MVELIFFVCVVDIELGLMQYEIDWIYDVKGEEEEWQSQV